MEPEKDSTHPAINPSAPSREKASSCPDGRNTPANVASLSSVTAASRKISTIRMLNAVSGTALPPVSCAVLKK